MSKKDFKNNPALKFISEQKERFGNITKENTSDYSGEFFDKRASEMEKQDMYNKHNTDNTQYTENTQYTHDTQHTDDEYNMYKGENNNYNEISPEHQGNSDISSKKEPDYTYNTEYMYNTDDKQYTGNTHELKNQRLNLLLKPTVLKNLKKIAHIKRTSVNSLINNIAENYILSEVKIVDLYDELYQDN